MMNRYVGAANALPDSRTPRRFMSVSITTRATLSSTVHGTSAGKADVKLATPEVTDTATVRM
jgi:hypothetical protein